MVLYSQWFCVCASGCFMVLPMDDVRPLRRAADDPAVAWQNVVIEHWDEESWEKFLNCLTPRQLVYQMRAWCLLAEGTPDLAVEFDEALDQVRRLLRWTECVSS